jgi:hypothetical protein
MAADPETRAVAVFTFKRPNTIAADGGTQSWRLDPQHIGTFNYAILARCRSKFDAEDDLKHGTAFLLGRVLDIVPSTEPHNVPSRGGKRRWLFRLSEAAPLNIPGWWRFGRWPTVIRSLDEFGINPADHTFQPLSDFLDGAATDHHPTLASPIPSTTDVAERAQRSVSEIIAEHKIGISREIGVSEDQIEISVRF